MKVDLINAYKEVFKEHLRITQSYTELYKYECLNNFQAHWDLAELDLHTNYDSSFSSKISGRLWGGSQNSAKSMMLSFIEMNKEFVRSSFRDLTNENKDFSLRVNRFLLHCKELLAEYKTKVSDKAIDHLHEYDEAFLYLCFIEPDKYPLYSYGPFKTMMTRLQVREVPEDFEIDRYYKLSKALYTMLTKDVELLELHKAIIQEYPSQIYPNMLIVDDYLRICSQKPPIN